MSSSSSIADFLFLQIFMGSRSQAGTRVEHHRLHGTADPTHSSKAASPTRAMLSAGWIEHVECQESLRRAGLPQHPVPAMAQS